MKTAKPPSSVSTPTTLENFESDLAGLFDDVVLPHSETIDFSTLSIAHDCDLSRAESALCLENEPSNARAQSNDAADKCSKRSAKRSRKTSTRSSKTETIAQKPETHQASVAEKSPINLTARREFRSDAVDEDSLKIWWKRVHTYPLLSSEREIALAKLIEAGDESAVEEMIECNLRLVASIARKCKKSAGPLSLADLVQEGSLGLIRAVHKFDYRKGYKFSTYASYWIRQAILRSIDEQSRAIRLPVYMLESASRAERARISLTQELQRVPTDGELARHLRTTTQKVQELYDRVPEPMSLDACVSEDDDSTLSDFIEDTNATSPFDSAVRSALREELLRAFECLSVREVEVLSLRYGLGERSHARTLDEVGVLLNLTRERIRQIEKIALKRLKRSSTLRETARDYSYSSEESGV